MYCTSCGRQFEGKYCPECGKGAFDTGSASKPSAPAKKPFYKLWWVWVIVAFLVIIIAFGGSSGESDTNNSATVGNDISTSTVATAPKATSPKIPVEFASDCPVTISASIEDNIIGVPELSCHIRNNTDKEIAAVQLYFIPKDVYGDEVNTIFTTNKLYSDTAIRANGSETLSWQMLDDEVKSGEIYIYSVYFSDGTEWGDKDTSISNIKKYGVKINTEN